MKCIYIICIFILSLTSTLANVVPARPLIYQNYIVDRNDLYWYVQGSQNGPPDLRYVAPNVSGAVCGNDITNLLNTALANVAGNNGFVALPPCPFTNPFIISATILIPSNTALTGAGRGITWIKEADGTNLAPMVTNTNFGGGAGQLDKNIIFTNISLNGNNTNQSGGATKKGAYFIGVANVNVVSVEETACVSTCTQIDGNGAQIGPCTAIGLYIHDTAGIGLHITHAERRCTVDDISTENTKDNGVFIDASEGSWTNIRAVDAGCGRVNNTGGCTSLNNCIADNAATPPTGVDNPGGGAGSATTGQSGWSPCPAGIYIHNVTDLVLGNLSAERSQFYGILVTGLRHSSGSNWIATSNSQSGSTGGPWDDCHLGLSNNLPGYGEISEFTLVGLQCGQNSQVSLDPNVSTSQSLGTQTTRYCLAIEDGIAGSMTSAYLVNSGTGGTYAINNVLTLSGGTSTFAGKIKVLTVAAGKIVTFQQNNATNTSGMGAYTVLPANAVSVTGGGGTGATFNINWASFSIVGFQSGDCITSHTRYPSFSTGIRVLANPAADSLN